MLENKSLEDVWVSTLEEMSKEELLNILKFEKRHYYGDRWSIERCIESSGEESKFKLYKGIWENAKKLGIDNNVNNIIKMGINSGMYKKEAINEMITLDYIYKYKVKYDMDGILYSILNAMDGKEEIQKILEYPFRKYKYVKDLSYIRYILTSGEDIIEEVMDLINDKSIEIGSNQEYTISRIFELYVYKGGVERKEENEERIMDILEKLSENKCIERISMSGTKLIWAMAENTKSKKVINGIINNYFGDKNTRSVILDNKNIDQEDIERMLSKSNSSKFASKLIRLQKEKGIEMSDKSTLKIYNKAKKGVYNERVLKASKEILPENAKAMISL